MQIHNQYQIPEKVISFVQNKDKEFAQFYKANPNCPKYKAPDIKSPEIMEQILRLGITGLNLCNSSTDYYITDDLYYTSVTLLEEQYSQLPRT